jgi:hypothetical protein
LSEWVDIASIAVAGVGSAAVATALVYSSRQVRALQAQLEFDHDQAQNSLIAQRAANDLELMGYTMALDRVFIDLPELRPYFYDGKDVPRDEPLRSRVMATAELIVDLADSVSSMMGHGQLDPSDQKAWQVALRSYGRSQAVRRVVEEDGGQGAWREPTLALLRGNTEGLIELVDDPGVRKSSG